MIGTTHAPLPDQDSARTSRPGAAVLRPPVPLLREWVAPLSASVRLAFACSFTAATLEAYWQTLQRGSAPILPLPARAGEVAYTVLDAIPRTWAAWFGASAAGQDAVTAGYQIGAIYTALLPEAHRATHGIYYTPPALTSRLLTLAVASGVDWRTARILDPACGGGAFLTPVALQIVAALPPCAPARVVAHLAEHLHGWELDPFGAWMSQVLVEAALLPICGAAGVRLPALVTICDALDRQPAGSRYDLVIGNPPYGRLQLPPHQRILYSRSLYGHANLYGVFTDLAIRWTRPGGVIAYVTPTSFLGGEYFKELRQLLAQEAPPTAIDLVTDRKGVFADVLQETLLATYQRGGDRRPVSVYILSTVGETTIVAEPAGTFTLPIPPKVPWIVPRSAGQVPLVTRMRAMPDRLGDYGYHVSTGPLVWNRHKRQLCAEYTPGAYPLIWAESVTPDGRFCFRAAKKNHEPFFLPRTGDGWLITTTSCVLVQRTTAKEQQRRLIAAELPADFIRDHGAVVVENHLNMIRPRRTAPQVSPLVLATLLNSETVDAAFRCISGSVAVSASELESLPLPSPADLTHLTALLAQDASPADVEQAITQMYLGA